LLAPLTVLAFRLSVAGFVDGRVAQTRLDLERFPLLSQTNLPDAWCSVVAEHIFAAFALLVRKADGWTDNQQARQAMDILCQIQEKYEDDSLRKRGDPEQQSEVAFELIGLYDLAQLIVIVADFLQTGQTDADTAYMRLDHHYEQATEALEAAQRFWLLHLADLLWTGCRELMHVEVAGHAGRTACAVSLGGHDAPGLPTGSPAG